MKAGFKSHYFQELALVEAGNFWFRGRNKLILWTLRTDASKLQKFLEIGCGTGFVISAVAKEFPNAQLAGSEYMEEGLTFARDRLPSAAFSQMDARLIPHNSEFDVIGAFDVIEHIEEDELVLGQILKALKPGGLMVVTVPQHPWLWSVVDEYACHVRRYSAKELHQKVARAGFEIIRSTSFVSTLLPAMYLSRMLQRKKVNVKADEIAGLRINPVLNKLFEWFLDLEIALIRMGISLPIGGTRLLVARKSVQSNKV